MGKSIQQKSYNSSVLSGWAHSALIWNLTGFAFETEFCNIISSGLGLKKVDMIRNEMCRFNMFAAAQKKRLYCADWAQSMFVFIETRRTLPLSFNITLQVNG